MSFSEEMIDLTLLTKKCFEATKPDLTDITGMVAELWTLIDLEPSHSIYLFTSGAKNKMNITVGRSDIADEPIETVIQKQYAITADEYILKVIPKFFELNDDPKDDDDVAEREVFDCKYPEVSYSAETLTADLVIHVANFMNSDSRLKLLDNPQFQASTSPLAMALRSALLAEHPIEVAYDDDEPSPIF